MRLSRVVIAAALFCAALARAQAAPEPARLGTGVVPVSYDLDVTPDVHTWTTSGDETIVVNVRVPTNAISLNWNGLDISHATIDGSAAAVERHPAVEQVALRSAAVLAAGRHELHLHFVSPINGFFGSTSGEIETDGFWYASTKKTEPFLVTMFEPSTARRFFPCFDEPGFRASITLHATVPADWTVVSNMPLSAKQPTAAGTRWSFLPTPPMPAYLLTFDTGQFANVQGTSDGVPIRVFAARSTMARNSAAVNRALSGAERLLHFYDGYFGVKYPLPKLDLVIAPGEFDSALEQWSAITYYSESEILGGAMRDPAYDRRNSFAIIAHEMAHQWFGDLVGMQWWTDTFVAEGLAQWAQEKADVSLQPRELWWQDDDAEADSVMAAGISTHSLPVVSPFATDLNKEDEAAFGGAVYFKGAAVLRMWESYAGTPAFRSAIQSYLHRNAGSAVTFDTFWSSFGNEQARAYGDAWLKRPGFPVVTVSSICADGHDLVELRQQPFQNGRGAPHGYAAQLWPVPVTVHAGAKTYTTLLKTRAERLGAGRCGETVTVDPDMRPYYRIRYTGPLLKRVMAALHDRSERDRINALDDALALYDAHYITIAEMLNVAWNVPTQNPILLRQLAATLSQLLQILPPGRERDAVAAIVRRVAEPAVLAELRGTHDFNTNLLFALTAAGDPKLAPAAARIWLREGKTSMSAWAFEGLAAESADDASVTRVEKLTKYEAIYYFMNLRNSRLALRVLHDYNGDPLIVFALARNNPGVVWAYLQGHAALLRRHVPPSQQGWTMAQGVANAFCYTVAPPQVQAFLNRSLGPAYRADIDFAVRQQQSSRAAAAKLARQVDDWISSGAGGASAQPN